MQRDAQLQHPLDLEPDARADQLRAVPQLGRDGALEGRDGGEADGDDRQRDQPGQHKDQPTPQALLVEGG